MSDLVTFLRARLDDDDRMARAATAGPWQWTGEQCYAESECGSDHRHDWGHMGPDLNSASGELVLSSMGHDADQVIVNRPDAEHIAQHGPSRVLADIAAKRAVLDLHAEHAAAYPDECAHCNRNEAAWDTIRLLAQPFRDHPDFDPAWTEETR